LKLFFSSQIIYKENLHDEERLMMTRMLKLLSSA